MTLSELSSWIVSQGLALVVGGLMYMSSSVGAVVALDPATGKTRYVFSCFNQDQLLDEVDFPGLDARLRQNAVQEKLTARWVARVSAPVTPD